jgi:hypothetical protein
MQSLNKFLLKEGINVMIEQEINNKISILPEGQKREILDYVEFISMKYGKKQEKSSGFSFNWEGGLSNAENQLDSVELQHKSLEWR